MVCIGLPPTKNRIYNSFYYIIINSNFAAANPLIYLICELFYLTIDELKDLHHLNTLASLMSLLMDCAKEAEILGEEQINELARPIFNLVI